MKKPRQSGRGSGRRSRNPRRPREIAILYEDEAVVAVNKPAGLAAVPVKDSDAPSAWSVLAAAMRSRGQRVFVVHRIDRFTSGIVLFAKTEADRNVLVKQFLAHTPVRRYLAAVRGYLAEQEGSLVHYFRRQGMFQKLSTKADPKAVRAEHLARRVRG